MQYIPIEHFKRGEPLPDNFRRSIQQSPKPTVPRSCQQTPRTETNFTYSDLT
jgi:hypothetical protein